MILLTLISSRQKTLVNLKTMVYTAPNRLGTEIVFKDGSRVAVTENAEQILRLYQVWHDSCTNSTNSTNSTNISEPKNTTPITTNTNSTKNISVGVVGEGQVLIVNNSPIPVDPSTKPQLYDY